MTQPLRALLVLALLAPLTAWSAPQKAETQSASSSTTLEAKSAPSMAATRDFIFAKLAYDEQYFARIAGLAEQGRTDPKMPPAVFQKELSRARMNLPVLRRFVEQRKAYESEGKPLALPSGERHREYKNLIALLNMFQAQELGRSDDVIRLAESMDIRRPEDFGAVRGDGSDFYVAMYRSYFFLVGSAHYALRQDARAVEWFARLEADQNLAQLKDEIAKEEPDPAHDEARRLEALRQRPVALMPLANHTGDAANMWMSDALLEVLTVDLARHTDLALVERAQMDKITDEMALALGGFVEPARAIEAGQLTGAGTLLVGAIQKQGDALLLTLRLVDAEGARVLGAGEHQTTEENLFASARTLVVRVLEQAGWGDAVFVEELMSAHAPTAASARALHDARLLMSTKQDEAKALYAKAMREDPALANLYEDLRAEFKDLAATLAVLPFTNVSGQEGDAWMARATIEALGTDLPKLDFNVVERGRIEDVLIERMERESALVEGKDAGALGAALGADFVVLGAVLRHAPTIRVDVRFVDVRTGLIVFATSAENKRDDLNAALTTLTTAIADRFNRPLDEATLEQLMSAKMSAADLERIARQQLADEALSRASKKQEKNQEKAAAVAAARDDEPLVIPWAGIGFVSSLVGVGASAGIVALGLALASGPSSRANQLHGLQSALGDGATKQSIVEERDALALQANLFTGLAYAGAALGVVSVAGIGASGAWLAFAAGPDETVTTPPEATAPEVTR